MENRTDSSAGNPSIEGVEYQNGKYLVKFPFLEIPVEVDSTFYQRHFEN